MRILKLTALLSVMFLSQVVLADTAKDQGDIEQVITQYVQSIDSQDANKLNSTVLPAASFVTYNQKTNKMDSYNASQFIGMVKGGQKGGWQRNVSVSNVTFDGNTAVAKLEIKDSRMTETGFVTLIKDNGTWKISSQVSTLQVNK